MLLDEIPASIMASRNSYEEAHGISTEDVVLIGAMEELALFHGRKSDGTITLFLAFRIGSGAWLWLCPNEETIAGLRGVSAHYDRLDQANTARRLSKFGYVLRLKHRTTGDVRRRST